MVPGGLHAFRSVGQMDEEMNRKTWTARWGGVLKRDEVEDEEEDSEEGKPNKG